MSGPTIVVKVLKAEKMRTSTSGNAPEPMMKLRINVDGISGPYSSTKKLDSTIEPSWNEEFTLGVKDPSNSQLECTLWDESDRTASEPQKFLGEVILNLAKLVPYNNTYIEQVFEIKQGKNYKATAEDKKATGKLKLGLKLVIPPPGESDNLKPLTVTPSHAPVTRSAPAPKEIPKAPAQAPAPPPTSSDSELQPLVTRNQAAQPPPPWSNQAAAPASPQESNLKPSQLRNMGNASVVKTANVIKPLAPAHTPAPATTPTPAPPSQEPKMPKGMVPPVAMPGQGKLYVTVHTIQNVPKSDSASGAAPFPYVKIALEGTSRNVEARTVTRDNTIENPSYGEKEFIFGVDQQSVDVAKLNFKLFDWNKGKDDLLGSFVVSLADVAARAVEQQTYNLVDPKGGGSQAMGANRSLTKGVVSIRWAPASGGPPPPQAPPQAPPAQQKPAPPSPANNSPQKDPHVGPTPSHQPMAGATTQPSMADVGLVLGYDNSNKVVVSQLIPGGPAGNSNQIRPGDALIDVDGHDVVGHQLQDVQNMLRGERNSPITMIFRRGGLLGGEQIVVTLLRSILGGVKTSASAPAPAPGVASSQTSQSTVHVMQDSKEPFEPVRNLKNEFRNLSFLWGEPISDAVQENMKDWKLNMLYGPKKTIPDEPVPPPPGMTGIMPEGVQLLTTAGSVVYSPQHQTPAGERIVYSNDSHLAMRGADIGRSFNSGPAEHVLRGAEMRRSFNSGPAEHAVHANNPLYRSFDQGSSLRYGTGMRLSNGAGLEDNSFRVMREPGGLVGLSGMPYPAQGRTITLANRGSAGVFQGMQTGASGLAVPNGGTSSFIGTSSLGASLHQSPLSGMKVVDKNEMVC